MHLLKLIYSFNAFQIKTTTGFVGEGVEIDKLTLKFYEMKCKELIIATAILKNKNKVG